MSNATAPKPPSQANPDGRASLSLDGVMNFRDAGSLVTQDGKRVKQGVLWRSAGLEAATSSDIETISALGLAAIADLRGDEERRTQPTHPAITKDVRMIWSTAGGLPNRSEFMQTFNLSSDAGALREMVEQLYRTIADKHESHLRLIFDALAAGALPILIHCAAGKDRTGVVVAIILETLGVDRGRIIADYCRTNDLLDWDRLSILAAAGTGLGDGALNSLPPEAFDALKRAESNYLEAAFVELDQRHGGVLQFLERRAGVSHETISRARQNLLED